MAKLPWSVIAYALVQCVGFAQGVTIGGNVSIGFQGPSTPRQSSIYCTGSGDTAIVQAAITAIGTGGGDISLYNCTLGALTISAQTKSLKLDVFGMLTLTAQLVLPGQVHLIGIADGTSLSYQVGPVARVTCPTGTSACIKITGQSGNTVENLSIQASNGPGILMDGANQLCAYVRLKNTSIITTGVSTSIPLLIDSAFEIWLEHSSFISLTGSYPASIRVTTTSTTYSAAGLIFISDSVIAGHGIQLDAQVAVSSQCNISIDHVTYENANNSVLRIDSTNGVCNGILAKFTTIADSVSVPYFIEEVGATPIGINTVHLIDSGGIPLSNVALSKLNFQTEDSFDYSVGYTLGPQRRYASLKRGTLNAEWDGGHTANQVQTGFGATLAVNQDATSWTNAGGTITTAQLAPDGSSTATKITSTSGVTGASVYSTSTALTVGDWIIAGVWIQSADASVPTAVANSSGPLVSLSGGSTFDNGATFFNLDGDLARMAGSQWTYVWGAQKIATTSGTSTIAMNLKADPTHPSVYWMPWAAKIANGTMSDFDVMRIARSVSSLPSSLPTGGGIVALAPNQTFQAPKLKLTALPTSCSGLATGTVWNNSGALGVCP